MLLTIFWFELSELKSFFVSIALAELGLQIQQGAIARP
jgi:hypothetical protein